MAVTFSPTGIYKLEAGKAPETAVQEYLASKGIDANYGDLKAMTEKVLQSGGRTYETANSIPTGQEFDLSVLDADVTARGGVGIKATAPLLQTAPIATLPPAATRNGRQTGDSLVFNNAGIFSMQPFDPNQTTNEILARFGFPPIGNPTTPPGIVDIRGSFQNILAGGVPGSTEDAFGINGASDFNNIINAISGKNALANAGRNAFDIGR